MTVDGKDALMELAANESCLMAIWHHHILLFNQCILPSPFKTVVLADAHYCGKIGAGLAPFTQVILLPAPPEKKHKALIQFIRYLSRKRSVGAIAPDGPMGPRRIVKPGTIAIAKKLGIKIVPCSFASTRTWRLPSWDRLHLPRPGSRIAVLIGPPVDVSHLSLEEGARVLENALNQLEEKAHESICSRR